MCSSETIQNKFKKTEDMDNLQHGYIGSNTMNGGMLTRSAGGSFTPSPVPTITTVAGGCSCGAVSKLEQVMRVNQCWQKDYTTLVEENNFCKVKLKSTEERVKSVEQENQKLQQRLLQLENQQALSPPTSKPAPIQTPHYTIDDIEALKQQLVIYKEDFEHEKEEHAKLKNANSQMKLELEKSKDIIEKLCRKNETIKGNYKRVNAEKDHIVSQLRKLTSSASTASPPYLSSTDSGYSLPPSNSQEAWRDQDFIPHSGKVSPLNFYGGIVERNGLKKENSFPRSNSQEASRKQDFIPHSGNVRPLNFYGGIVERD